MSAAGKEEVPEPETPPSSHSALHNASSFAVQYKPLSLTQIADCKEFEMASALKARIRWNEGVSFVAETSSGHAVVVDGAPDAGGRNLGPRPMELVLAGTAACTAFDVIWILKKARQPISDCIVEAEAERAADDPKVFTRIHFIYRVKGAGLNPVQVERAVKLSKEKYCSATLMLAKTAQISYEIAVEDHRADRHSP